MMTGTPFLEPVVTHDPFVMSSLMGINSAIRDHQAGRSDYLVES